MKGSSEDAVGIEAAGGTGDDCGEDNCVLLLFLVILFLIFKKKDERRFFSASGGFREDEEELSCLWKAGRWRKSHVVSAKYKTCPKYGPDKTQPCWARKEGEKEIQKQVKASSLCFKPIPSMVTAIAEENWRNRER